MSDELPNSEDSERAILASVIHTPSLLANLKNELAPERFYSQAHQKIYVSMLALYEEGEEITSITIANNLNGSKEAVGGVAFISGLTFGVPVMTNLKPYIKQVISTARKRWIIGLCERLDGMARNGGTEDDILTFAAERVDEARTKLPQGRRTARLLEAMLDDQAGRYRLWHKGVSNALPTGFPEIDDHLLGGGLVRSGLYILAARPSMGKTSLGLDLAANIAATGKVVYILSREMPSEALFDRLHSAYSGVERWKLRPGIFQSDYAQLMKTLPEMVEQQIIIDDASLGVSDVRASLREFLRKGITPDCLIVDYLQLLSSVGRTRNEEVGANSRALKGLAMEFGIPILTLSQLSRESAKQHREPELEDLRDSGEIEQDADAVFFLFGDKPEEGSKFYARTLKCSKQRDGELFRTTLTFNANLVSFRNKEIVT